MKIIISGYPGTGKTTLCRMLQSYFENKGSYWEFISSGSIFRKKAFNKGMTLAQYSNYCQSRVEQDILIENKVLIQMKRSSNAIVESRILGKKNIFTEDKILKIYIDSTIENCAKRIKRRESIYVS